MNNLTLLSSLLFSFFLFQNSSGRDLDTLPSLPSKGGFSRSGRTYPKSKVNQDRVKIVTGWYTENKKKRRKEYLRYLKQRQNRFRKQRQLNEMRWWYHRENYGLNRM